MHCCKLHLCTPKSDAHTRHVPNFNSIYLLRDNRPPSRCCILQLTGEQLGLCFRFTCMGFRLPGMETKFVVIIYFSMPCPGNVCLPSDNILLSVAAKPCLMLELCMLCVKHCLPFVETAQPFCHPSCMYYERRYHHPLSFLLLVSVTL